MTNSNTFGYITSQNFKNVNAPVKPLVVACGPLASSVASTVPSSLLAEPRHPRGCCCCTCHGQSTSLPDRSSLDASTRYSRSVLSGALAGLAVILAFDPCRLRILLRTHSQRVWPSPSFPALDPAFPELPSFSARFRRGRGARAHGANSQGPPVGVRGIGRWVSDPPQPPTHIFKTS